MEDAVKLMEAWAEPQLAAFAGATLEVVRLPGRTPLIFIEVPGDSDDTVLLYGHLDKQPEMKGWAEGMGPWIPVRKGDKLYGRGGADDGYAMYACLSALQALAEQKVPRARCVIMIEACEESGSYDLPFYVDHLMDRIGKPSLVVCLDSGCGDYDQLWLTTSLRGIAGGTLTVRVLTEGVHSGDASGIVPSSLPHRARAAVAPRGRGDRRDQAARPLRPDPAAAHRAGQGGGATCWASRSTPSSRSPERRGRWPTTSASWC